MSQRGRERIHLGRVLEGEVISKMTFKLQPENMGASQPCREPGKCPRQREYDVHRSYAGKEWVKVKV